jgi:LysM repeat protein
VNLRKSQCWRKTGKLSIEKDAPDFISGQVLCHAGLLVETSLIMTALRFIAFSATCLALVSCENTKKSTSSAPYASNYGNDGHYNPYPGQSGYASSTPKYQTPPAPASLPPQPEAPASPYSFSSSKKVTPPSSHSAPHKKATASSSTTKKKPMSSKSAAKSTGKKSTGAKYTVAKGDTLSAIARKKGTSVSKIKAANGLSGDLIRPGQSLKIP